MTEYKKSLEDTIDWTIIDQLHAATARFSSASTEIKKIFISILAILIPILVQLAGNESDKFRLDKSLFIAVWLVTLVFWYLDGYTYYFQEKLRYSMDKRFNLIKVRNSLLTNDELTLADDRSASRIFRSALNQSNIIYPVVVVINTTLAFLFNYGIIA